MPKHLQTIAIWLFCLLLASPAIAYLFGQRGDTLAEKRLPRAVLPMTTQNLTSAAWFTALGQAFEDRLPLRPQGIAALSFLTLHVFGETIDDEVVLGRDGWIFYHQGLQIACVDPAEIERRIDALAELGRHYARQGKRLMFVIAPDKESVYPEMLSDRLYGESACQRQNRQAMREAMLQPENRPFFVDLWGALGQEKARRFSPVYRQYDSHWNMEGAMLASRALMQSLSPGLWQDNYLRESSLTYGQIGGVGMTFQTTESAFTTVIPASSPVAKPAIACVNGEARRKAAYANKGGRLYPGRTVMLRDSFFTTMQSSLAPYFAWLEVVHIDELLEKRLNLPQTAACADTLIVESVERSFLRRRAPLFIQAWQPSMDNGSISRR